MIYRWNVSLMLYQRDLFAVIGSADFNEKISAEVRWVTRSAKTTVTTTICRHAFARYMAYLHVNARLMHRTGFALR